MSPTNGDSSRGLYLVFTRTLAVCILLILFYYALTDTLGVNQTLPVSASELKGYNHIPWSILASNVNTTGSGMTLDEETLIMTERNATNTSL